MLTHFKALGLILGALYKRLFTCYNRHSSTSFCQYPLHHLSLCTWLRLGENSRVYVLCKQLVKKIKPLYVGSCKRPGNNELITVSPNLVFKKDLTSDLR